MASAQKITKPALRQAIRKIDESRLTHVRWADWLRSGGQEPEYVGDLEHHDSAIAGYDHVLGILREMLRRLTR